MKRLAHSLSFLHPLCFVLSPLLSLYAINRAEVQAQELLRPLLVVLAGSGILLGLFYLLSHRTPGRAALTLSVSLFGLFSFALMAPSLEMSLRMILVLIFPGILDFSQEGRKIVCWLLVLTGVLSAVLWGRYETKKALLPIWAVGLSYLSMTLYSLFKPSASTEFPATKAPVLSPVAKTERKSEPRTPDLYCIVLDAYGRQDQLQALYGLDNTPFLKALETRGFRVLRKSHANYIQTVLAVAATLNLEYLPSNPSASGVEQGASWIQNNQLVALLRTRGYQIIDVPSGFSPTTLTNADQRLTGTGPVLSEKSPYERLLLSLTPLAFLLYNDHPAYDKHRAQLLASLSHIADAARIPGPKFVFVHVLAPHPPFVLGRNGEAIYPTKAQFSLGDATDFGQGNEKAYRTGYTNQLLAINQKVLEALDALQKNKTRPAVIVLMGDHGSRMQTDWKSRERTNLNEAFSNFQAVLVPGGAPYLTDDLTPINTFRLILTHVYGENFPRLPNRSYYSTLQNPLKFEDITDKLR